MPRAAVAPHGGHGYSGSVAATSTPTSPRWRSEISRVILLGPAHVVRLDGMALPGVDAFATSPGMPMTWSAAESPRCSLMVDADGTGHADGGRSAYERHG